MTVTAISASDFIDPAIVSTTPYPLVIAGGALRDSWYDKPVKDLDVFVFVPAPVFDKYRETLAITIKKTAGGLLFSAGNSIVGVQLHRDGGAYEENEFVSFSGGRLPGVNVIIRPDSLYSSGTSKADRLSKLVPALLEEFPCSLSRVAWNPEDDTWWMDSSFIESARRNVCLIDRDVNSLAYYRNKIEPKYKHMPVYYTSAPRISIGGL